MPHVQSTAEGKSSRALRAGSAGVLLVVLSALSALSACGGGQRGAAPTATAAALAADADPSASRGQVAAPAAAPPVTYYAAARFADQTSFGATPALVAEIRSKGLVRWIDDQLALPVTLMDHRPAEAIFTYPDLAQIPQHLGNYPTIAFARMSLSSPDQLRLRVAWALSQFVTAAYDGNNPTGGVSYFNVLYGNAMGNYRQVLLDISLNRQMGAFLNNDQNRPKSAECQHCAPNENFARELMQLFSIGVVKLNPDGTPQRDGRGRFIETYTQRDVEELARMLTGWTTDPDPPNRPPRNSANWMKPMVPSTFRHERDSGAKQVMGRTFRAGQPARKDLEDAVDLLMNHPNIAPFVATRLIQHLVKSNPTPAYVGRVAAVFVNNGAGVRGDMQALVRAVLLDVEARSADNPAAARGDEGKIREPWLHRMALWRGLGCTQLPASAWGVRFPGQQVALMPRSVFSFYAPTDRAPGSNLLAPEQKLLLNDEFRQRLSEHFSPRSGTWDNQNYSAYQQAGCRLGDWAERFARGSGPFIDMVSEHYFRGAMPPTLRSTMEQMMRSTSPPWNGNDNHSGALTMIGFALNTPYFGAMR
jgi:uncharacterized protein (DUF1800 family)